MKSHEYLLERAVTLDKLRKLKEAVDPASGMTVMVRRGVAEPSDEDQAAKPWIVIESALRMDEVLDLLIANTIDSVKQWQRATKNDIENAQSALEAAAKIPLT